MQNEKLPTAEEKESLNSEKIENEEDPSNNQSNEVKNEKKSKYPLGIPFLLSYKFCERFSFYVLFVILTLYLHEELNFDENTTQTIYHFFMMVVYLMPIVGAILADLYLAKFWTIITLGSIFCTGLTTLFTGSTLTNATARGIISIIGLLIISVANGGNKPCTSSFGGDQFADHHKKFLKTFYSLYYFNVYCAHISASFLAPILRSHVQCFGKNNCYPLAFGTPALMQALGITMFVIGKRFYRIVPVESGTFVRFFQCISYALSKKIMKNEKKNHWLDYAEDKYDKSLIADIKVLFYALQVFVPLPVFVTLFHQVGSTWVLQGSKMDGEFLGYRIKADQMVIFLPVLTNFIIPTLDFFLYPLLDKLGLIRTPLQRLGTSGVLNALAFIIAGFLQLRIESELPIPPKEGFSESMIINNCPCTLNVTGADTFMLQPFDSKILKDLPTSQERQWQIAPTGCSANATADKSFTPTTQYEIMMITLEGNSLGIFIRNDERIKHKKGNPRIRLFFLTDYEDASFLFRGTSSRTISANNSKLGMTEYWDMDTGEYEIFLRSNNNSLTQTPVGSSKFRNGGSYAIAIYQSSKEDTSYMNSHLTLKWNSVHILNQLPQYIVMSFAKALFCITGASFSYNEAPDSLKTIMQSFWFMTYSFGNALLLILTPFVNLLTESHRFFVYGIILLIAMGIFTVITHFYSYVNKDNKRKNIYFKERPCTG